jgi:Tfp pilus assembly protein PilV
MRQSHRGFASKGFTLIEAAVAIVITGVGVTALMAASGAFTRASDGGIKLSQAVLLAQEVREWTVRLPFSDPDELDAGNPPGADPYDLQGVVDDLDDLSDAVYDPPRSGQGSPIGDMVGWSQTITLTWVDPETLEAVLPGQTDAVRVEVSIGFKGGNVFDATWLVMRREGS